MFRLRTVVFKVKAINKIVPTEGKESITVSDAGRLGGLETLRRHGRQHFVAAGHRGQEVIAHHYTTEDRRRWGSLGGRPKKPRLADMGGERAIQMKGGYGSPPGHRPFFPDPL